MQSHEIIHDRGMKDEKSHICLMIFLEDEIEGNGIDKCLQRWLEISTQNEEEYGTTGQIHLKNYKNVHLHHWSYFNFNFPCYSLFYSSF